MSYKGASGECLIASGLLAGASFASKQYYAVKLASTAGEVVVCNGTAKLAIGLIQNDPADGEAANVAVAGVARGKAGGSITVGQMVNALSTGTLQGTSGGTSGTQYILGFAMEAASSGDEFSVLIHPFLFGPS